MANRSTEKTALKLAFAPDDYLCTWHVPVGDGKFADIQGLLTVQPSRPPTGQIYGELPIEWKVDSRGRRSYIGTAPDQRCADRPPRAMRN